MRTFFDKLLDSWGAMSPWNQYGIAFVGAVILITLLWSVV